MTIAKIVRCFVTTQQGAFIFLHAQHNSPGRTTSCNSHNRKCFGYSLPIFRTMLVFRFVVSLHSVSLSLSAIPVSWMNILFTCKSIEYWVHNESKLILIRQYLLRFSVPIELGNNRAVQLTPNATNLIWFRFELANLSWDKLLKFIYLFSQFSQMKFFHTHNIPRILHCNENRA